MSLDKAVLHKKEHRKPYRGARNVSQQCRDGRCPHCRGNDLYANIKRLESAKAKESHEG
jgi:hypothetical protein